MKAEEQIKSTEPTPDQLLQLLEIQLQATRAQRLRSRPNRTAFRVMSILLILGACGAALLFLQFTMADLSPRDDAATRHEELKLEN